MSLKGVSLPKPGSYGISTQDSIAPNDSPKQFMSEATNLVIDSTGKLCSRKDFVLQTASFAQTLDTIYTHRKNDGTDLVLSAANGKIYSGIATLTERYNYAGLSTTLNSWQFASLSGKIFGMQAGVSPIVLDETTFTSESFTGAPWTGSPNVVIAADGRLWAADDNAGGNRHTVWWSNLLDGKVWNTGDAGNLNVQNVWPSGQDNIVALAFMSGRLVILGRYSILLYTLPADHDPSLMELTDVITNIGCSARDSVVISSGDLYFLSDNGVYKIPKLAQTISLLPVPVKISKMIADLVIDTYAAEDLTKVRAGYNPKEHWYVINAPTANKVFCFHLNRVIPDPIGVPAVTTWTNVSVPFRGFCFDRDGNWYAAMTSGVGKFTGYTPDGAGNVYSIQGFTLWDDFADETRLKHLKSWAMTLETASGQTGTFKWRTDYMDGVTNSVNFTCSAAEFSEDPGLGTVSGQMGRSCNVAKFGFSAPINGDKVSLHAMRLYAKPGATRIK